MFTNDFPWYKTMGFKALMIVALMLSVVVIAIVYVLETTGADMVKDSENQRVEAQVETVAQSLGQLSNNVSTIALSLADTLSIHDSQHEIERKLATMLSNENIKNIVAGGGFWPEPFVYRQDKSKASVFIAFNEDGSYRRITNYNSPDARPYQIEEWYAPARLVEGSTYWSRAYVDPYTKEPMVTCSVPIFSADVFHGVVTIDVKLDELQVFLKESGEKLGGYLMMLDRSGHLMSLPRQSSVSNLTDNPLPNFREIAQHDKDFSELALVIGMAMESQYLKRKNKPNLEKMATQLVSTSPDIDLNYAFSVADELFPFESVFKGTERLFIHHSERDFLLEEPTLVLARTLPSTHWILVGALPERLLLAETEKLKNDLFSSMVFVSLLLVCITYIAIHINLVSPMARVRNALIEQGKDTPFSPIDYNAQNELGILVHEFNQLSTHLVEARENAIDAAKAKQLFLANISHEIRTPMNGILGAVSLMQDESMTGTQTEYLSIIAHSSRGLMSLINNILDFSKMESNHLTLENAAFDLEDVGRYVRDLMMPTIKEKPDLHFNFTYQDDAPRKFIGDAHRIEQIILNLVSNALKFTESGRVTLSIRINQDQLDWVGAVISVSDTGVGIAPDKFNLIFDEFQQADVSTTRCFGGSGLGLTITKQLVELMKGNISLTSQLGEGTQFDVCLPLQLDKQQTSAIEKVDHVMLMANWKKKSCLLVEDNAINMMIAEKMLMKLGFVITKAKNGNEATQRAVDNKFDMIFMDIQMPKMDGLEATRLIRTTINLNQTTPIVAMTANVSKDDIWCYLTHGMQAHIGKPLKEKEIYKVVSRLLTKSATVSTA